MSAPEIPPAQMEHASRLLDDLTANKETWRASDGHLEYHDSRDIIVKAESLIAALESPIEWTLRTMWQEPTRNAAVRVAIDVGIFKSLSNAGEAGKTSKELTFSTNADQQSMSRMLRHLASTSIIKEVAADTYASNSLSKTSQSPNTKAA